MRTAGLFVGLLSIGLGFVSTARALDAAQERFETKVRPVLAEHCIKCHGPDKQSSGLRLDSREALIKGGDTEGTSIVPGNPDASPLIKAIRHQGDVKMPPKSRLPEPAVVELSEWIKAGAPWPKGEVITAAKQAEATKVHWSFQPVRKVAPPASSPGVSPIDAFLNADLAKHGLKPAGRADRKTLIRRASFDLTGLPPTPDEVDAFLADARPDAVAFAEVVEHLLASPHYGERWGRLWLDVARYADTKGYVFNEDKNYAFAYTYRDWVVDAFNEDLPYDKFILQQIAADKLPHGPDNRPLAAMGFLTVGRRFLQDQNEIIDDRIDVVSRGLLGLSVACARCHDHKFDPIPTEDYYSFYGIFASSEEPKDLPLLAPASGEKDKAKELKDYEGKIAERKKAVATFQATKRAEIEKEFKTRLSAYLVAAEELDFNPRSPKFDEIAKASTLRPELLRRVITGWNARLGANDPRLAPWKAVVALPPAEYLEKSASAIRGTKAKPSPAPAALVRGLASTPTPSRRDLAKRYGDLLARSLNSSDKNLAEIRAWLESPESPIKITDAEFRRVLSRPDRDKMRALEKKVAELDAAHPGAPARAMVMVDKPQPVEPHVFIRGNAGRPGKQVPRRFLKVISAPERVPFKEGSGRLDLARSIVRPDNPLTSRVMVNRIWMNHFGQGLVRTPSDYGLRGDPPTHPALLDWLAATFVERGWSIKAMHRMLMATDAYQRRSDASPDMLRIDPQNLYLARQNRRRLDFESMRDALLAVAGRLDTTIGGKPVPLENQPFTTRRALYGYIDRYNLDPVYRTFDFPNPDTSSPKRAGTIVPQQALYLLNSPFVAEQAKHVASRSELSEGGPDDRVRHFYRLLYGRDAEPREIQIALRYLNRPVRTDDEGPTSPWQYGTGGVVEAPGKPVAVDFRPFPHWTGKGWQLGDKIPTADGNYASLNPEGGHPGPDGKWATIIRWIAPADLDVAVSGMLNHPNAQGDGVRARVVSNRAGLLGTWNAHKSNAATNIERIQTRRGDVIDFIVDCKSSPDSDSYTWSPAIHAISAASSGLRHSTWNNRVDFHGPEPTPLSPWEAYAQALLLSNEFLYVD
jgi:mono/diheme cytochrome c family protein